MRQLLKLSVAIGVACSLGGCASVKVLPVKNDYGSSGVDLKSTASGVRFYRPALHVWLTRPAPSDKVDVVTTEKGQTTTNEDPKSPPKSSTSDKTTSIRSTAGDALEARLVMLPDLTQEYVVQWAAGAGSVNPNFSLADGWNLTAFNSTVDSKASEHVTAIASLGTAIGSFGKAGAGSLTMDPNFKGPGLYKLEFTNGHYQLGAQVLVLP